MKAIQWISLFLILVVVSELFLSEEADAWRRRRRRGGKRRKSWFKRVVRKAKDFVQKHGKTIWNVYKAWRQSRKSAPTNLHEGRYKRSLHAPPIKVGSSYLANDAASLKQMVCSWKRFRAGSCAKKITATSQLGRSAHAHTLVTLSFADRLLSFLSIPGSPSHPALRSTDCCESGLAPCSGSNANQTHSLEHQSPRSHPILRPCRLRVDPENKELTAEQCRLRDTEGLDRVERMLTLVLGDLKHQELSEFNDGKADDYVRLSM